ncbi:MAG: FecR domain-containing protein, partial [Sphingobium yanoikuyae]|nr:FecR domain-containing protein [Sphingobium yanoikuyae]
IAAVAPRPSRRTSSWMSYLPRLAALAASLLIAAGLGFVMLPARPEPVLAARTDIGQRRLLELGDGSRIEMNTRSAIRAQVGRGEREVWIDEGEVYFEVFHDAGHPFVVHAGNSRVTVLGTRFSVRRDRDRVIVSVSEGKVRVDDGSADAAARQSIITAGDIAIARGTSMLITRESEQKVDDQLAWRPGILRFDQQPLGEVVAEFNRYNQAQIAVTDPAVAQMRMGGVFQSGNVDAFLRLLEDAYGLHVSRAGEAVKISR